MTQQSRKLMALAAFLALASEHASAFTPAALSQQQRFSVANSPLFAASDNVSVDYDAAAKLAYDEWRNLYGKGDFDAKKFQAFKTNYEALTIVNVKAAKKAREEGTQDVQKLELNEFADMTVEEYQNMQSGSVAASASGSTATTDAATTTAAAAATTTTTSPLQAAMDALNAQNAAADAISEAAAALAQEEEVGTFVGFEL
jgi:activator of HSP90 ATPase